VRLAAAVRTAHQEPALWLVCILAASVQHELQVKRCFSGFDALRLEGLEAHPLQLLKVAAVAQLRQTAEPAIVPSTDTGHCFAKLRMAERDV